MPWIIIIVLATLILLAFKVLQKKTPAPLPYRRAGPLFSPAERSFLGVLDQVLGAEHRVFGKVRVADLVSVATGLDRAGWQRAFNRINAKHFDYVICRSDDLSVVAVIELDDRSHQSADRIDRDRFIDELCSAIRLPLLRIRAQKAYSAPQLRADLESLWTDAGQGSAASEGPSHDSDADRKQAPG